MSNDPDVIIEGGTLLSMVDGQEPLDRARVSVKGDRIVDITTAGSGPIRKKGIEIIDAGRGLIMPGLVNAHAHSAMTLFRGLADDLPLKQWLFEKIFPAEALHLNPETVYWGSMLACLEMIASGTTTLADGYFYQDATVGAIHEAGLRALVAQGVIDFPAPGVPEPRENLRVGRAFIEKWLGLSDLIRPGLFCHSPLTCSERTLREAAALSETFSLPLQIHLSETGEEVEEIIAKKGKRPVHYLEGLGILSPRLIAAHVVHLSDDEIDLLGREGVKPVHVPESNMKLSSGVAPMPRILRKGLTPALGTDGCASNNDLDLFREMDSAAKLHKAFSLDPVEMNAETVLKMATVWGADALGLGKEVGTVEVGKKADLIVVDLDKPHLTPLYNPMSTLVYAACGSDVKDVVVNGKVLMKNRSFMTLDSGEIMAHVTTFSRGIRGE